MKKYVSKFVFGAIVVASSAFAAGYTAYKVSSGAQVVVKSDNGGESKSFVTKASYSGDGGFAPVDLTGAAERSVHAVVHIKSTQNSKTRTVRRAPDIYDFFFGDGAGREQTVRTRPRVGFGSGVILTEDGYIVTNNHVIADADEIMVTLNDNRSLPARLIGADENTDLALIKVESDKSLEFLPVGDSDELRVGEWVLAVGNPFNLTSTVTAGIVSAKTRSLGVYDGGIESFIQTDAAINQGNSGGALVNAKGELVGVNAVLSSPTGSYAGYGFAIPVSIMTKVVSDLKEYGAVQRAVLGIVGGTVTSELNEEKDLGTVEGVYVSELVEDGAAKAAGIEVEDVIIGVDGKSVKTMAEMQEVLAKHLPGDKVEIVLLRDKKEKTLKVELKNVRGNTSVVKSLDLEVLGAELKPLDEKELKQYGISCGLKVTKVDDGLFSDVGIRSGFAIVKVNGVWMKSLEDLQEVVKAASASNEPVLFISGVTASGRRAYYSVPLSSN